jgi:hypothetical protein
MRRGASGVDIPTKVLRHPDVRRVCPLIDRMVPFVEEAEWQRLIHQLRNGECTPFLGAGACYGTLPTGSELSRRWAEEYRYPFADDTDLARVMQYAAVTTRDSVYIKQLVCTELGASSPPDFSEPTEPHALLADFPLRVFLTTNYDDFQVQALKKAGRQPRTAICPWYDNAPYDQELFNSAAGLDPSPEEPLVYHLHGSAGTPTSLVLTEDDYLEFLVNIARAQAEDDRRLVPSSILAALTTRPLLFIGYSLQDWTFRVLFHGLLRAIPDIHRRPHVSVQLPPPLNGAITDAEERAYQYLTRYLERWKISIFWGTSTEFCTELRRRTGAFT